MSSNRYQKEIKIGNKTVKLHNSSNHYQNKGNNYNEKKFYQNKSEYQNNNNEKRYSHYNERDHSISKNHIHSKRERSHSHSHKEKHVHHKHEKNRRYSHSNSPSYSRENSNKNRRYSHSNSRSRSRSRDNSNNNKNYYYQRKKYNNNKQIQYDDKLKQFKPNNFFNNQFQNNPNFTKGKINQNFNINNLNQNYNCKSYILNPNNQNNQNNQIIYNLSNTIPNQQPNIYNYNNNNQNIQKTKEPSNTFILSNLGPDINNEILEDIFREKCLEAETSMPEDIRLIESLNLAYIIFPSISVAMKLYEKLNGKIIINGSLYNLSYTPNTQQINNNRESITYVTHLIDNNSYTTSMETTVHEDWYCEYCDCKNFSRRVACFKCKRPKTLNCRIAPVIKQKTTIVGENGKIPPSTSLMVRGDSIKDSNEGEVSLIIFNNILSYEKIYVFSYINCLLNI